MEKIGTVIQTLFKKKSFFSYRLAEAKIFIEYREIVGEKLSEISVPLGLRNKTLFIGVKNPIWSHQLHFLKPEIIDKINSKFSRTVVKNIIFKISNIEKPVYTKAPGGERRKLPVSVPEKKLDMIYNISLNIDDEELRKKFYKLMIKDAKFKIARGEIGVHPHRQ